MYDAKLLVCKTDSTPTELYGPWFPRGGDNAAFTVEVCVFDTSATFTVNVYHKNTEDTGDGSGPFGPTIDPGAATPSGLGRFDATYTELKELVRFRYKLVKSSGNTGYVMFRMLEPMWYNDG